MLHNINVLFKQGEHYCMYQTVEKQCMDSLSVDAKRNATLLKKTCLHCNSHKAPYVRFLLKYILFL